MKRLAAAIAAIAMLGTAASVDAAFPGGNGRIVLTRRDPGPFGECGVCAWQIWLVKPHARQAEQLSDGPKDKGAPAFSADGRRIVFTRSPHNSGSYSHIAVMGFNTRTNPLTHGPVHELTHGRVWDDTPHFSPDGRRIVFARYARHEGESRHYDIYVVHRNGRRLRRLVRYGYAPVFSPNGRAVAFEGMRRRHHGIYTIGSNGRNLRQLTVNPYDPGENGEWDYSDWEPDYSPDGARIAFIRAGYTCTVGMPFGNVFTIGAHGGPVRQLTMSGGDCGRYYDVAFSPNGRQLVADTDGPVVMRTDGTHPRSLPHSRHWDQAWVDWQPRPRRRNTDSR